jgi:hypothetical protein
MFQQLPGAAPIHTDFTKCNFADTGKKFYRQLFEQCQYSMASLPMVPTYRIAGHDIQQNEKAIYASFQLQETCNARDDCPVHREKG